MEFENLWSKIDFTSFREKTKSKAEQRYGSRFGVRCQNLNQQPVNLLIPGSKSYSNRALVLAGMTSSEIEIRGLLLADDVYWGVCALQELGFFLEWNDEEHALRVSPPATDEQAQLTQHTVFLGKAGTLARFLPAVILNFERNFERPIRVWFKSDVQLSARPLKELTTALRGLGAKVEGDKLPFRVESSVLKGRCEISGATSGQFLSGLLLAAAGSGNLINISRVDSLVQPDYVRMTLEALKAFGARISHDDELTSFTVHESGQKLFSRSYCVEADASTACYFIAFAVLHKMQLTIKNLNSECLQPDLLFIEFLKTFGADVSVCSQNVTVKPAHLKQSLKYFDFSLMSDQALTAAVFAVCLGAELEISGVAHTRHHESNRVESLVKNLNDVGVSARATPSGFVIDSVRSKPTGVWNCCDDHRFAMSGFLLASRCEDVVLEGVDCVEKTVPDFFERFEFLGVAYEKYES